MPLKLQQLNNHLNHLGIKLHSRVILMEHEGYYHLGTIVRTHGVKGNIFILLDVDDPLKYKKLSAVFLQQDSTLKKYTIINSSLLGDLLNVHLQGIEDMTSAESFLRVEVYLPLEALPPLSSNQLYLHEAVGMVVIDHLEGELGVIGKIFDMPQQPMASVQHQGKEILFPVVSVFIDRIDRENRILYVNLPEGLLDIYLK